MSSHKTETKSDSKLFGYGQVKEIEKPLTADEAIRMVSQGIDSWTNATSDAVTVTNLSAGYLNTLWLVERKDSDYDSKIIVRIYGGNNASVWKKDELLDHGYGRELESIVASAASRIGIGPKVYCVRDTFRIEEFVESRNFSWNDYDDDSILGNFARNLACFHSMIHFDELQPFREVKIDLFAHADHLFDRFQDKLAPIVNRARDKYQYTGGASDLLNEFDEMKKLSSQLQLKNALINWDLNTMNILVRDEVKHEGQLKTVLIDYEFAHCNLRCFDIGITAFRSVVKSSISDDRLFLTEREINDGLARFENVFLSNYYQQYINSCKDLEVKGIVSWRELLIECYFGSCWTWMYGIALLMLFMFPLFPDEEKVTDIIARKLSASFQFNKCAKRRLFHLRGI